MRSNQNRREAPQSPNFGEGMLQKAILSDPKWAEATPWQTIQANPKFRALFDKLKDLQTQHDHAYDLRQARVEFLKELQGKDELPDALLAETAILGWINTNDYNELVMEPLLTPQPTAPQAVPPPKRARKLYELTQTIAPLPELSESDIEMLAKEVAGNEAWQKMYDNIVSYTPTEKEEAVRLLLRRLSTSEHFKLPYQRLPEAVAKLLVARHVIDGGQFATWVKEERWKTHTRK